MVDTGGTGWDVLGIDASGVAPGRKFAIEAADAVKVFVVDAAVGATGTDEGRD